MTSFEKLPEKETGTTVFKLPFPQDLKDLKNLEPLIVKFPYNVDYLHSYGQDSPFFAALTHKKFISNKCPNCGEAYGTPRGHCMECGAETEWVELPQKAKIHTFTVCYFGSQAFLKETPFILVLAEWDEVDTLFLGRLVGVNTNDASLDWIGKEIKMVFKRNCQISPTDVYFVFAD